MTALLLLLLLLLLLRQEVSLNAGDQKGQCLARSGPRPRHNVAPGSNPIMRLFLDLGLSMDPLPPECLECQRMEVEVLETRSFGGGDGAVAFAESAIIIIVIVIVFVIIRIIIGGEE